MKNRAIGILLAGISIYFFIVLISKHLNINVGILGRGLNIGLYTIFGGMSFFLIFVLFVYGILLLIISNINIKKIKVFAVIIFFISVSVLLIIAFASSKGLTSNYTHELLKLGGNGHLGGMFGTFIAYLLYPYIGRIGISLFAIIFIIISLVIFFEELLIKYFKNLKQKKLNAIDEKIEKGKNKIATPGVLTTAIKKEKNEELIKTKKNKILFFKKQNKDMKQIENKILQPNNDNIQKNIEEIIPELEEFDSENKNSDQDKGENLRKIFKMKQTKNINSKEMQDYITEKIRKLEEILLEYKINAKVVEYQIGPVITRFELSIDRGIRVKKVVSLADDIAMNLEAKTIRIEAPIPGKNRIGIEMPNKVAEAVEFSEIYNSNAFKNCKSELAIILGKDIIGETIVIDLKKMPHLLIAGRTGSGKSVCVNSLIASILMKSSPDKVKFIMIDPKMVELMPYNDIEHLLVPVIIDPKVAAISLKWAVSEMEERYTKLSKVGVRNLESYNSYMKLKEEKLPYIVIVIDEFADLMMVAPASLEESISRIAQKARAVGIHLVMATQRPSTDVVTGTIKANLPSRISFALASQIDSRTILDTQGAEKLLGRGDMLYLASGASYPIRIQGAFISDEKINQFTNYLKKNGKPKYNEAIIAEPTSSGELDDKYAEAIEVIRNENKVSTSFLQRKLRIGYSRAARIIDQLQENGIVNDEKEVMI